MKNLTKVTTGSICSISIIISIVLTGYSDEIRTSKAGLELIGNAEGCRHEPYYCPAKILTVGIGSTKNIEHRKYSDEEIAQKWVEDIKSAEQCVNKFADGLNLPQSVFDSTVSITFNIGCTKMKNSTMFHYLNKRDYKAACNELTRWNKVNGAVMEGLVKRREKERALCLSFIR